MVCEALVGSRLYGLETPESDYDYSGVFAFFPKDVDTIEDDPGLKDVVHDNKKNTSAFELRKFFRMLSNCSPNAMELLWAPREAFVHYTATAEVIREARDLVISKKAALACLGFANKQVEKATGQNKRVMQPQPKDPPRQEDFCHVVSLRQLHRLMTEFDATGMPLPAGMRDRVAMTGVYHADTRNMPVRPTPLSEAGIFYLSEFHAARLEGTQDVYRLYWYGSRAKGVFRSGALVCESIPKEDEWIRFVGLLIWNQSGYAAAKKKWKEYWVWMRERNPTRWEGQDGDKFRYDRKNMMHCLRGLMCGLDILETGRMTVRVPPERRELLMRVRAGELTYEEVKGLADDLNQKIKEKVRSSQLPGKPDLAKLNEVYQRARLMCFQGCQA